MDVDSLEKLVAVGPRSIESVVRDKYKDSCANCGGAHKVKMRWIVPLEVGGKEAETNATLICRACEMSMEMAATLPGSEGERRLINFWVSRKLYSRMSEITKSIRGLKSLSALVRFVLSKYVEDAGRFDDLDLYRDPDATNNGEVKLNVWVPASEYEAFKSLVNQRGWSVTESVRALIMMFDSVVLKTGEVSQ